MRGGVAILIATVSFVCAFAAAGSDAATNEAVEAHVQLRLKSVTRQTAPFPASAPASRKRTKSATAVLEESVIARMNAVRRARGLRPLTRNARLAAAARFHSGDMARKGYFEHDSANGTPFWRRIERFYPSRGYRSWTVGENLLWGSDTYGASFAIREWMASPPHRANILSRAWREVGIGAVFAASASGAYGGGAVTIITADFGART